MRKDKFLFPITIPRTEFLIIKDSERIYCQFLPNLKNKKAHFFTVVQISNNEMKS